MEKNILISARINLRALIFWLRNKKMADKQMILKRQKKATNLYYSNLDCWMILNYFQNSKRYNV
jgi:hypothetical protein